MNTQPTEQGATPRTDAAVRTIDVAFVGHDGLSSAPEEWVEADFARALERDNARLQADCERLRGALERIAAGHPDGNPAILHDIARAALRDAGQA